LTFRNRFLFVAGAVLLTVLVAGSYLAHQRLVALEQERAVGELTAASEVTRELVRERTDHLSRNAQVMADMLPLHEALESGEWSGVMDVVERFAVRHRELSFLLVNSPASGDVIWASGPEPGSEISAVGRATTAGESSQGVTVVGGRLITFASRPVRDPSTGEPVAGLVIGTRVDTETIGRLARLTGTEVVVLADGAPVVSTLPPGTRFDTAAFRGADPGITEVVEVGGQEYLARLEAPGASIGTAPGFPLDGLLLLRSLQARRAMAGGLLRDLALTTLLGTVLALGVVLLGSRRLRRALGDLTEVMAETAANGRLGPDALARLDQRGSDSEVEELRAAFRELMRTVEESLRDRERSYVEAIGAVVAAIDARDHETTGHSFRVAHYALALARSLGVERKQLRAIEWGSLLHDVGKIAIPDAILRKSGRLTEDEWHVMRQHPSWGYEMLADVKFLEPALEIVYSHHERWDGEGYPRGLTNEEIPLAARIFSVVDTYDSITSDRPYRRARSHGEAIIELCRVAGTQLDPDVVEAFIRLPEVEIRRLRDRSERLDLKVRIPDVLSDLSLADDGTWG
jgi:putative nucleotidyltransferase with HDIG domain